MTLTETQYNEKLLCYWCNYGTMVYNYQNKLKFGNWCSHEEQKIKVLYYLINIYNGFDTRDLPELAGDYNEIEAEDLESLMDTIEELIG